jgi:hypothetical protein
LHSYTCVEPDLCLVLNMITCLMLKDLHVDLCFNVKLRDPVTGLLNHLPQDHSYVSAQFRCRMTTAVCQPEFTGIGYVQQCTAKWHKQQFRWQTRSSPDIVRCGSVWDLSKYSPCLGSLGMFPGMFLWRIFFQCSPLPLSLTSFCFPLDEALWDGPPFSRGPGM